MDYVVVIEKLDDGSFSAHVPDLPGCVTSGDSVDEVRILIKKAVTMHIDPLRRHEETVPAPATTIHIIHAA
ncbi:MAG: type II toxin-antitoxin system HicB family antitoxin [Planctomycetota bacterium]|nr:MAG: type II toxin-antitoxin system HicB family antitoxin [Planctomycetota bacterium]